jgi:hypothetical protein
MLLSSTCSHTFCDSQLTTTRLTHSSRSSSSLGSGCLYTLLTKNLPVSALFLIPVGDVENFNHF